MHKLDARVIVSVVTALVVPSPYIFNIHNVALNRTDNFLYSLTFTMLGYHRQRRLTRC